MVLEILCLEPIYPQYSGILETCLALRYWFFEVLGSESVNVLKDLFFYSMIVIYHSLGAMRGRSKANFYEVIMSSFREVM